MKRSLIAAAVLGTLAGAASAQSPNVTLFGLVDVFLGHSSAGSNSNPISPSNPTGAGAAPSRTALDDGVVYGPGSRWGVRVAEPISGDLTVGTLLESGFDVSTGASTQGGRLFGRQGFLYAESKTWGELRLGRQYVFADVILCQGNPFGCTMLYNPTTNVTNNGRNVATMLDAPRADNVVRYRTPEFNGFWAGAMFAPHENASATVTNQSPVDSYYGFAGVYNKGPLFLGVAYEYNDQRSTGNEINKSLSLSGKWDFGPVRLMGNYQKVDDMAISANGHSGGQLTNLIIGQGNRTITLQNQDGYLLGAEIPWQAFTFGVAYTRMKYEGTPSAAGLPSSYTLGKSAAGFKYELSKRTYLYSDFSIANGDLKDYISQQKLVQLGMGHRF